jgi:hypothetical protein
MSTNSSPTNSLKFHEDENQQYEQGGGGGVDSND